MAEVADVMELAEEVEGVVEGEVDGEGVTENVQCFVEERKVGKVTVEVVVLSFCGGFEFLWWF